MLIPSFSDSDQPIRIGRHLFLVIDGHLRPYVCGGIDDGGGGGEGEGEGQGEGEGEGEGQGEGEGEGEGGGGDELPDDPAELKKLLAAQAAEAEKWRGLSKKHEGRAKTNHAELEKLRKQGLPEDERKLAEEREAGRAEARAEVAQRLASAEIKAALTGVVKDPSEFVEDLNLAKFVTDDGEVDDEAVKALAEKVTKQMGAKPRFEGGADGGGRGKTKAGQLTQADLKTMTPDEIVKAKAEGRFDDLLGVS